MGIDVVLIALVDARDDFVATAAAEANRVGLAVDGAADHSLKRALNEGEVGEVILRTPGCLAVHFALGARTRQDVRREVAIAGNQLRAFLFELGEDLVAAGHRDEATVFREVFGGWCPPWSSKPVR